MRTAAMVLCGLAALLWLDAPAAAQGMVEYGAAAANASGTAGAFKGLSKTIDSAAENVEKTATPAQSDPPSRTVARRKRKRRGVKPSPTAVPVPTPKPHYEDALQIRKGMAYDELLRRFGPPVLAVATGPSSKSLSYMSKSGPVQVECSAEKVISAETLR